MFSALLSCSSGGDSEEQPIPGGGDVSKNEIVKITPNRTRVLRNPLNGWVMYGTGDFTSNTFAGYDNIKVPGIEETINVSDYANTLYLRTSWTLFNPEEGVYGWDTNKALKALIHYAKSRDMRLAFRVVVDSRDKHSNFTPGFVKEAGAEGFYSQTGSATVWSPYCDDPIFQEKYEKFIKAFAEKFDNSDVVDFIDGYGLGKWGESHAVAYKDEGNREQVFKWVVDLYLYNFKNVALAINYHRLIGTSESWGAVDSTSESLLNYALSNGYILRQDAFGMTDYYQSWERSIARAWNNRRPILMEGGWIVSSHSYWNDPRGYSTIYDVRKGEFDDSKEGKVNTMDFRIGNETMTWFQTKEAFKLVTDFVSEGGYRLAPAQVSVPTAISNNKSFSIAHRWRNLGWGYCPTNIPQWNDKYKVAFALLDPSTKQPKYVFVDDEPKLCDWVGGKVSSYTFTETLSGVDGGDYIWAVGIVDKTKDNSIGIELATNVDITTDEGWVELLDVKVN